MNRLSIFLALSSVVVGDATNVGDQKTGHIEPTNEQQNQRQTSNVKVDVCLDATKYFGWSDGDNFLRLYHECICTGDLKKDFRMECTMKDYCFTGEDGLLHEKCLTRRNIYDFHVDPDTGFLKELRGIVTTDIYQSGFAFSGNFTSVSSTACIQEVRAHFPQYGIGQVLEVCNENCPAFLAKNQYSQERIEELCPETFLDGVQCNSHGRDTCRKLNPRRHGEDAEFMIYLSTPDCSNVYPCLTSSCQAYPQVDIAAERRLFRYPQCDIATGDGDKDVLGDGDVLGGPSNVIQQSAAYESTSFVPLFIGTIALFFL